VDREHRVRQRADVLRLQQTGRRLGHPLLRLQFGANGLAVTRFGFIVGKRVAPAAHDRNRLRRRLRELARLQLPRLAPGLDIIVLAQPAARSASYADLAAALAQLLARGRLLRSITQEEA
jgi:ribonuclease P protein component